VVFLATTIWRQRDRWVVHISLRPREQDPVAFLRSFKEYAAAIGWSDCQKVIAFKLALRGEAGIWLQTQEFNKSLESQEVDFIKRFQPANSIVKCITELAEVVMQPGKSLLAFLDRMKMIALRGQLPENVLLAMALKALPVEMVNRLVIAPEGLTWEFLRQTCSVWMDDHGDGESNGTEMFCDGGRKEESVSQKRGNSKEWRKDAPKRGRTETIPFKGHCMFCDRIGHKKQIVRSLKS